MNRYLIKMLLLLMMLGTLSASAQENRNITFTGYPGLYPPKSYANDEYLRFDTLSQIAEHYPVELNGTVYEFYVLFKIDTLSNVVDLKLVEISICRVPPFIKACIEGLIRKTSGQWTPQMKNGQKIVSDELIWQVHIMQEKRPIKEQVEYLDKFTIFKLDQELDKIVKRFVQTRKWRVIYMPY